MADASGRLAREKDPRFSSVDVRIAWGDAVLLVAELAPPRPLFVGSDDAWSDGDAPCACALPEAALGVRRVALVDVEHDGAVFVFVPPGASVELVEPGRAPRTRAELIADAAALPSGAIGGGLRARLAGGARIRIESGAFAFEVCRGAASSKIPRARFDHRGAIGTVASAAFHLALLAVVAVVFPPLVSIDDDALITADVALAEPVFIPVAALPDVAIPGADAIGDVARRGQDGAVEQAGAKGLGEPRAPAVSNRYGLQGPRDNPDPHLARRNGDGGPWLDIPGPVMLRPPEGDPHAPLAPWGRDDSLGNDPESARGEMWGDEIDEAFGAGGLGLAGESECGCGSARALAPGVVREFIRLVRTVDTPSFEPAAAMVGPAAASRRAARSR